MPGTFNVRPLKEATFTRDPFQAGVLEVIPPFVPGNDDGLTQMAVGLGKDGLRWARVNHIFTRPAGTDGEDDRGATYLKAVMNYLGDTALTVIADRIALGLNNPEQIPVLSETWNEELFPKIDD